MLQLSFFKYPELFLNSTFFHSIFQQKGINHCAFQDEVFKFVVFVGQNTSDS